jgi:hypothetical protein
VDRDDLQIMTVVDGTPRPFFSEIEIRHMYDVWDMFKIGRVVRDSLTVLFVFSLLPFAVSHYRARKKNGCETADFSAVKHWDKDGRFTTAPTGKPLYYLGKCWKWGAAVVLASFIALAALVSINWVRAWHFFHELLFTNDDWLLDSRVDLLVNIVPYDFFFTMTVVSGAIFVGGLVLMLVVGVVMGNQKHI